VSIVQRLKHKLGPGFNVNDHFYAENNLVKLQVYFKDILYKNYTESPSYSVSFMSEKKHNSTLRALFSSMITIIIYLSHLIWR